MASSLYKAQEASKTCIDHEYKELSCFCKTCRKFICSVCAKTAHNSHDWDLISSVAKERRRETPKLCREIKQNNMQKCQKKLSEIDKTIEREEKECTQNLEYKRKTMSSMINRIIDRQHKLVKNEKAIIDSECRALERKMYYLEKVITNLETNSAAYSDYDVIEMEEKMLTVLREIESYDADHATSGFNFVQGDVNEELIKKMIGGIEEKRMTVGMDRVNVTEVKTFKKFDHQVNTIATKSSSEAWVGGALGSDIKHFSLKSMFTKRKTLGSWNDFITLTDDDFIVTYRKDKEIRRVTDKGKIDSVLSTEPLYPTTVSLTETDAILVSLRDDGDLYKLQPSSRRLIHRMTLTLKVLHTYEFQEDGTTRLFTLPYVTAENGNSDICAINATSANTGELIVLHGDGRVRFIYGGQGDLGFNPTNVACDSMKRIIVTDYKSKSLHLLSPDGTFLRYLLSDMSDFPTTVALYKDILWIGFKTGTVKVYIYTT